MLFTWVPITAGTLGALSHSGQDIIGLVTHRVMEDGLGIHQLEDGINLTFPKRTLKSQHIKPL